MQRSEKDKEVNCYGLFQGAMPITVAARSKVGRIPACVKTCNSQDTMSAT
jgi:hypothetical protein